jgi:alpha-D-ribose 1-methylphosphonate 5-triphosphate synthase subunit PhnL
MLHLQRFSKHFDIHHLEREVQAFEDVTLEVSRGAFVLVSGANGVGKSTLLRCLYRTYKPTSGQAFYESAHGTVDLASTSDRNIVHLRRREIGMVTQFLRPRPRVSALELVAEPLLERGEDLQSAKESARQALATFGLKEALWNAYPTTFSGGEQQKVNLARALIAPYRLLLLDEPTASLDSAARSALVEKLSELKGQKVTMLGVFHHPEDVAELIDETLELSSAGSDKVSGPSRTNKTDSDDTRDSSKKEVAHVAL